MDRSGRLEMLVTKYESTLFRAALAILGDVPEAEDAVQDTFLRYLEKGPEFRDEGHERAWLLKVTANGCKSRLRSRKRRRTQELPDSLPAPEDGSREVLAAVMALPATSGRRCTSITMRATPPARSPPFWASGPGRCAATSAGPGTPSGRR